MAELEVKGEVFSDVRLFSDPGPQNRGFSSSVSLVNSACCVDRVGCKLESRKGLLSGLWSWPCLRLALESFEFVGSCLLHCHWDAGFFVD